jgi:putative transcriptional regulator
MLADNYGTVRFHLAHVIAERGISKNKLVQRAEMQRGQLNKYCREEMQRIDLDILARLCHALDCSVADLLEYIPPEE